MKAIRMMSVLFAISLLAAACGGGGESTGSATSPTDQASQAASTSLTMNDNAFAPKTFTTKSGTQITLTNQGAAIHNLSVEGQRIDKDVNAGETETETIELAAGTYTIFCKYHRGQGMEGTLTVTG